MKTAILVIGHIRTWLECKDNFIDSFQHLNPDVFVSTYDLQYNYHPAQQHWMAGEEDKYLSDEEIRGLFNHINLIGLDIESVQAVIDDHERIKSTMHINFRNEAHTYFQCRKISRGTDLITNAEVSNNRLYDSVIKIRADINHNGFNYTITEQNVIISDGNVFPNDVIIAASRNNFIKISDFLQSEFYNPIYVDSHLMAPHNLFLRAFEHFGLTIEQKYLMNYVMRRTGKHYYKLYE